MQTKQTLLAGVAGIALIAAAAAFSPAAAQSNLSTQDQISRQQQTPNNGNDVPHRKVPRDDDFGRAVDRMQEEMERRRTDRTGLDGGGDKAADSGASESASVDGALGAFDDEDSADGATGDGIRRGERFADHGRQRQIPEARHTPTPGRGDGGTGSPSDHLPDPGSEHHGPGGPGSGAEAGLDREASGGRPGPVTNPGGFAHGAVSPEQFREAGADVVTAGPNSTYAEGTYQDSEGNTVHWRHHSVRNDDGSTTTHLQERTHYPDGSETVTRTKTECDAGGNCHSEDGDFGIRITGDSDPEGGGDGADAGSDAGAGESDMEFTETDVYGDGDDSDGGSDSEDSGSDDSDSGDSDSGDSADDTSDDSSSDDSGSDDSDSEDSNDESSDSGDDGSDGGDSGEDGESSGDVGCDPRVPDAGGCSDDSMDRAAPWRYDEKKERQKRKRDNLISGDPWTQPDPSDDGASGGGRNPRGDSPSIGPDGDPFGPDGRIEDSPPVENCFSIGCWNFVINPDPTP